MATTDTRAGFRLPWSTDHRSATDEAATVETAAASTVENSPGTADEPSAQAATDRPDLVLLTPATGSAEVGAEAEAEATEHEPNEAEAPVTSIASSSPAAAPGPSVSEQSGAARSDPARRPTKFLADLTKAMQVAAQTERDEMVGQYHAETKSFVEQIRAEANERATDYRLQADEDVASIRDWSNAEMARIREATDRRIAERRTDLESQLERHSARVEREIERVQGRVGSYEDEMARFFERLLTIEDPTAFAALAASMPEPPAFAIDLDAEEPVASSALPAETVVEEPEPLAPAQPVALTEPETAAPEPPTEVSEPVVAAAEALHVPPVDSPDDIDPRIAALGLTTDFAAAETEAAVDAASSSDGDGSDGGDESAEIPVIADDALAARLAGLVPVSAEPSDSARSGTIATTQVVVVGLVSVASIAGFKRHLARVPGVQSVGVSSGPDGEFVFSAVHHDDVAINEIVPTLPGFQARVTSVGDGVVHVTARDPESVA